MSLTFSPLVSQAFSKFQSNQSNWAIFVIEKSNLNFQDEGQGELTEFLSLFDDGKLQFAIARVQEPTSKLFKIILISWVKLMVFYWGF